MSDIISNHSEEFLEELIKSKEKLLERIELNPDNVNNGLVKLVLTVIELLRQVVEKQVMRTIDKNLLTDEQVEKVGLTLMKLEQKMEELKTHFELEDDDLKIKLGTIQNLE